MTRRAFHGLILLLLVAASTALPAEAGEKRIAITFDDLPLAGRMQTPEDLDGVTRGILDALRKHGAPASGFVTTRNVMKQGQIDLRMEALRKWVRAGHDLENHSNTHRSFQRTPIAEYQDDIVQGDVIPRTLMGEAGRTPRYFRHPFNHTGKSPEEKSAFEEFMAARGYTIVPFTAEHADYAYNDLYEDALQRGNAARTKKIGEAYLQHLREAMEFAESLSRETFGREIPQVFLIHSNAINGRYLDQMLQWLSTDGYRFITLEEALRDEALQTRDDYVGPSGISWLHRWRKTLGKEDRLRAEPDPPRWVLDDYRKLTASR